MKAVIDFVKNALRYIGKILGFITVPAAEQSNMISPEKSTEKIHSESLQALNIKNTKHDPITEQCTPNDCDKLTAEIHSLCNTSVSATTISTTAEVADYKNRAVPIDCCLGKNKCSTCNDYLNSVNCNIAVTRSQPDQTTIKYTTGNDSAILRVNNGKSISHDESLTTNTHNLSIRNWRKGEKERRKDEKKVTRRIRLERTRKLKMQSQTDKEISKKSRKRNATSMEQKINEETGRKKRKPSKQTKRALVRIGSNSKKRYSLLALRWIAIFIIIQLSTMAAVMEQIGESI